MFWSPKPKNPVLSSLLGRSRAGVEECRCRQAEGHGGIWNKRLETEGFGFGVGDFLGGFCVLGVDGFRTFGVEGFGV